MNLCVGPFNREGLREGVLKLSERKAGRYSSEKLISFISNTRTWDVRISLFQSIWETSIESRSLSRVGFEKELVIVVRIHGLKDVCDIENV